MPTGEKPTTAVANSSDAHENETDYIITRDELNDATYATHSRTERLNNDVSKRNEANEAAGDENSDWPNPAVYPKNAEKSLPTSSERPENDANLSERNSNNKNDAQISPKEGDDYIVHEISRNDDRNESLSPRGGNCNLRPNPDPNYSEDFRD